MTALGAVIANDLARRDGEPLLEREVFGTGDPACIAVLVDEFCRVQLGAPVAAYAFFATSVGSVHGLELRDGRRVVVKGYRRDVDVAHLRAVQAVQAGLADQGFPAPAPLLGPVALVHGFGIAETLLDRGEWADGHRPEIRRAIATGLADLVGRTRGLPLPRDLRSWWTASEALWRVPHDPRFDFRGTSGGAEWIDGLAEKARARVAGDHARVVGHADWRVQHLRFQHGAVSAVYDWDSLVVGSEPIFAGAAAHSFTADWSVPGLRCAPNAEESLAFLEDYETARGRRFDAGERRTALGALVASLAYSARCEHSDRATDFGRRPAAGATPRPCEGSFGEILARDGERLLGCDERGTTSARRRA